MIAEVDKLIALRNAFRCRIYHCTMSLRACAARQRNAQLVKGPRDPGHVVTKPGFGDANCRDCDQGRENIKRLKEQFMDNKQKARQIIEEVCKKYKLRPADFTVTGKKGRHSTARREIVYRLDDEIGTLTQNEMAQMLGVHDSSISLILRKRGKAPSTSSATKADGHTKLLLHANDPADLTLHIDFTDYADVLAAVRRIAAAEVRTPEGQILYWLKNHVHREGAGDDGK